MHKSKTAQKHLKTCQILSSLREIWKDFQNLVTKVKMLFFKIAGFYLFF